MAEIIKKKGKKYNIFDKINQVWNQCSLWTHSDDVEFDDGQTASTKLSAINGITTDLNCEDDSIAASAAALNQVNRNLGGNILSYNESEDAYYIQYGADTEPKKLGSGTLEVETNLSKGSNGMSVIKGTNVTKYNTCTLRATTLPGNAESPSSIIQSFMKPDGTYENVTLILDTPVDISSYSLWYENFYNGALSVGFVRGFRLVFN